MFDSYNKAITEIIHKYSDTNDKWDDSHMIQHRNMLTNALTMFYQAGHRQKAQKIYDYVRALYPRPEFNDPAVESYIIQQIRKDLKTITITKAMDTIMPMLRESYFRYALRDDDASYAIEKMAEDVYNVYTKQYGDEARLRLPELRVMKFLAFKDFCSDEEYPLTMRQSLLARIKIEQPKLAEQFSQIEEQLIRESQQPAATIKLAMMFPSTNKRDDDFASQLTASQQKAVFHRDGPLLVIAGPGSGKTRVITCRIAALVSSGVPAYNICAITFTNKAADEMRQRAFRFAASAGAHISTFHSLCVRILRRYSEVAGITPNFSIYDDSDQSKCVKQSIVDCNLNTTDFSPARTLDAISTLKNKLIDADAFEKQADDFFSKTLSKIYSRYQQILKDLNAVDFDDLLMKAAFLLENNAAVREELGNRYKYLLIDEYQDTNHAQYRIAKALASSHKNICATGDPDQSIYRWRGADIRNILDFERDWPNAVVVRLEENFRSAPCILEVADRLIANNQSRKEKRLIATKPPAGKVVIEPYEDEVEEAIGVAENIRHLVDEGVSLSNIAIFYRVNAQSRAIEEAFIRSKIPYQIVRGVEFYNRKEVRDVLAYLKVIVNPADKVCASTNHQYARAGHRQNNNR